MGKGSRSSKDDRRAAQERLAAEREAQARADRRRSLILGTVTVVIIALIAGAVAVAFVNQRRAAEDVGALPANTIPAEGAPGSVGPYGAYTGTADPLDGDIPVLEIYEDFQCPACKQFEDAVGEDIKALGESGDFRIVYHPMQFLDANLGNDSSARAANASGCAADAGNFLGFHDEVFANQPEREGTGYTDDELIAFGATAGLTDPSFATCVRDQTFAKWAKNGVQRESEDRGVSSTPTFFVNGTQLNSQDFFTSSAGGWQAEEFIETVRATANQ
jgi:protein-disulfide isomerase